MWRGGLTSSGSESRIRILRGAVTVDAVMQMHWSAARVAGIAGVTDDVARLDAIAGTEGAIAAQVRVVVALEAGTEDPHHLTAKVIGADAPDETARRTQHRRVLRGKDVDALMPASARSRIAPRVDELRRPPRLQGIRQCGWRRLNRECADEPRAVENRLGHDDEGAHCRCRNQCARECFHAVITIRFRARNTERGRSVSLQRRRQSFRIRWNLGQST